MACPFFEPVAPRFRASGPEAAMLPLGDQWAGICRAEPEDPWAPDEASLRMCNLGYARGACARFPEDQGPDAVRFSVRAGDADSVRLYYVLERDHHPFAFGSMEYSVASGEVIGLPDDGALASQAQAYARSFLRRKSEAAPGPSASGKE